MTRIECAALDRRTLALFLRSVVYVTSALAHFSKDEPQVAQRR